MNEAGGTGETEHSALLPRAPSASQRADTGPDRVTQTWESAEQFSARGNFSRPGTEDSSSLQIPSRDAEEIIQISNSSSHDDNHSHDSASRHQDPNQPNILDILGAEIIAIVAPVSICMLLVVLMVLALTPHGAPPDIPTIGTLIYQEKT